MGKQINAPRLFGAMALQGAQILTSAVSNMNGEEQRGLGVLIGRLYLQAAQGRPL